jgi:hypothetical protein
LGSGTVIPDPKTADEPNDWTKCLLGRAGLRGLIDTLGSEIEEWFGTHVSPCLRAWLADLAADAERALAAGRSGTRLPSRQR